jgi:hypothetical protein
MERNGFGFGGGMERTMQVGMEEMEDRNGGATVAEHKKRGRENEKKRGRNHEEHNTMEGFGRRAPLSLNGILDSGSVMEGFGGQWKEGTRRTFRAYEIQEMSTAMLWMGKCMIGRLGMIHSKSDGTQRSKRGREKRREKKEGATARNNIIVQNRAGMDYGVPSTKRVMEENGG